MPNSGRILLGFIMAFYMSNIIHGQKNGSEIVEGSYIIQVSDDFDIEKWKSEQSDDVLSIRPIFPKLNYWRVDFNQSKSISQSHYTKLLAKSKEITQYQNNLKIKSRLRPNDPMYVDQWSKSLIEVEDVWDVTTGGTTADGDEIVIAVIDDGFDISHPDLAPNIWTNRGEIEGNDVDDDGNGYVDDFIGLNLATQDDDHIPITHGMGVSGIIGAVGNNGEGITGVNWDIKMMLLSLFRNQSQSGGNIADVIEGLGYAIDQREKYNNTEGAEGAFVVAVNWSGGVSEQFPSDLPMWCPVYDELGKVGILNFQAVENENINIDAEGDMPSLCPSEFMITVTNTDIADRKINDAAFSNVSVDMGAPGEDALSLGTMGRYAPFNGTSSATPQVAGVAALLYSLPCTNLIDIAKSDPEAAALMVKRAIFDGVDAIPALDGITVTGGRLNALNAMIELDKESPVIENCPTDVILREDNPVYVWDELVISDDCGSITVESNIPNAAQYRIGTTDVIITATDLLGNSSRCEFTVTREGESPNEISFLEVQKTYYNPDQNSLFLTFETGSFETHIIDIYNITGQLIRREFYVPTSSDINQIEITEIAFATGTYLAVVSKAGGGIRDTYPFLAID